MKKVFVVLLALILVVGVFVFCTVMGVDKTETIRNNILTSNESKFETTKESATSNIETSTSNKVEEKPLTQADFYLYKQLCNEIEDGFAERVYTYREDGQVLTIVEADELRAEYHYDENGMLQYAWNSHWGEAYFYYEYSDGMYIGTGTYEGRDVLWQYIYDDNYNLITEKASNDSESRIKEIIYDENGNMRRTIETSWITVVKNFNDEGVLIDVLTYDENGALIEQEEYDSVGRLSEHVCFEDGESYQYSEFVVEGDMYIENIYRNKHFVRGWYDVPEGTYVLEETHKRKYDEYGNLIWYDNDLNTFNYEYRLKDNV